MTGPSPTDLCRNPEHKGERVYRDHKLTCDACKPAAVAK
jgi:hypothetical protein